MPISPVHPVKKNKEMHMGSFIFFYLPTIAGAVIFIVSLILYFRAKKQTEINPEVYTEEHLKKAKQLLIISFIILLCLIAANKLSILIPLTALFGFFIDSILDFIKTKKRKKLDPSSVTPEIYQEKKNRLIICSIILFVLTVVFGVLMYLFAQALSYM